MMDQIIPEQFAKQIIQITSFANFFDGGFDDCLPIQLVPFVQLVSLDGIGSFYGMFLI